MEENFLIIESKNEGVTPRELAITFLRENKKMFKFRYTKKGIEEVLFSPKYSFEEIKEMYSEALKKGITKTASERNTDVRKIKMYFLVNGFSVEKIHQKRGKIISRSTTTDLSSIPCYKEIIDGGSFDEIAEKYNFSKKDRKNVIRNLKKQGYSINRLTVSQRTKAQLEKEYEEFKQKYFAEIVKMVYSGKNISEIKKELQEEYHLKKTFTKRIINDELKEEYNNQQKIRSVFKGKRNLNTTNVDNLNLKQLKALKKGKEKIDKFKEEKGVFGYIYRITNLINGYTYIGKHQSDKFDLSYWGSGVKIVKAIKHYGRNNFFQEIVSIAQNKKELNEKEQLFIKKEREKGHGEYNVSDGGEGAKGIHLYGEKNPFFGKHHSLETREKLSEYAKKRKGKNSPLYGRKMTPEHIAKTRRTGSTQSAETRKKISEAGKKKTACPICNKVFPSRLEMSVHYKKVHTPENKKRNVERMAKMQKLIFICPYCSKEIHSKGNLTQHVRAFHQERLEEYNQIKDNLKPKGNESEE